MIRIIAEPVHCALCSHEASGHTYAGTPLCNEHWQQTLSAARQRLLEQGATLRYPRLPLRPWTTLCEGEQNWRKFAAWGSDEAVSIALEVLACGG